MAAGRTGCGRLEWQLTGTCLYRTRFSSDVSEWCSQRKSRVKRRVSIAGERLIRRAAVCIRCGQLGGRDGTRVGESSRAAVGVGCRRERLRWAPANNAPPPHVQCVCRPPERLGSPAASVHMSTAFTAAAFRFQSSDSYCRRIHIRDSVLSYRAVIYNGDLWYCDCELLRETPAAYSAICPMNSRRWERRPVARSGAAIRRAFTMRFTRATHSEQ